MPSSATLLFSPLNEFFLHGLDLVRNWMISFLFRALLLACALPQILSKLSLHPKMVPFEYGTLTVCYIFLHPTSTTFKSYAISVHRIITWLLSWKSPCFHFLCLFWYIPCPLFNMVNSLYAWNKWRSMDFIMLFFTKFGPWKIFPFRNLQCLTYPLVKHPNGNIKYVDFSFINSLVLLVLSRIQATFQLFPCCSLLVRCDRRHFCF